MIDTENDILIAEPETEAIEESFVQETAKDDLFVNKAEETDFFEPVVKSEEQNKTIKKETDAFVNYNHNNLNKVYKLFYSVQK